MYGRLISPSKYPWPAEVEPFHRKDGGLCGGALVILVILVTVVNTMAPMCVFGDLVTLEFTRFLEVLYLFEGQIGMGPIPLQPYIHT